MSRKAKRRRKVIQEIDPDDKRTGEHNLKMCKVSARAQAFATHITRRGGAIPDKKKEQSRRACRMKGDP